MRILIAEDEPFLRKSLQLMLEMEGFEVVAAANGLEAFEHACDTRPDLVISDVMMPELDGFGLVKALRERPSTATVSIIMLSAKAEREDIRTGMNFGADDYLIKPCSREELLETIQARLARNAKLTQTVEHLQSEGLRTFALDALTGLPGRDLFEQQLRVALEQNETDQNLVAVLYFGMDGLSKVNQSLGKPVGDWVLRQAADRLSAHMNKYANTSPLLGTVGRLGGDYFAVRLSGVLNPQSLAHEATHLLELLAKPYVVENHTLFLTACAGASLSQLQSNDSLAPLINAESALYHAKSAGPGNYKLFDAATSLQVTRKLQIHNELHQALEQGQFQVYYQPQIRIQSGALVGFEALLRWNHKTLGWISPAEFIPIAEESGIIIKMGEWVMRTAAQQAVQWVALGHTGFRMAVNLSARQFADIKLPALVQQVLSDTGLAPQMLELEVTESLALQSMASTLGTLHECKALGIKLAMDDFGTGYSCLSYLKRYPLDTLKIDQSFIRNINQDTGDAAITRAIVAMAHSFGMSVIAEGVETSDQLMLLRSLNCENFQGYLFSKPVMAADAVKCFSGYHG
jgi:diguanylate cyclase